MARRNAWAFRARDVAIGGAYGHASQSSQEERRAEQANWPPEWKHQEQVRRTGQREWRRTAKDNLCLEHPHLVAAPLVARPAVAR